MTTTAETPFQEWALVELFGHRKLAGLVSKADFPAGFVRIDVYEDGGEAPVASPLYSPSAIYGITPVTEAAARRWTQANPSARPVTRYELALPPAVAEGNHDASLGDLDWARDDDTL